MSALREKKYWVLLLLLLVLFLIVFMYFFYLSPLKREESLSRERVSEEVERLHRLNEERPAAIENEAENWQKVQKHLPVQPLEEQFLLLLDEAATVNKIAITQIAVNIGESLVNDSANNETINDISTESEESKIEEETLPAGVEKTAISIQLRSERYEDLLAFMDELQHLERYTTIESLEMGNVEDEEYVIVVSIYHYPSAANSIDNDPKIVNTQRADKTYPFENRE